MKGKNIFGKEQAVQLAIEYCKHFIKKMPQKIQKEAMQELFREPPEFGVDDLLKVDGSLTLKWDEAKSELICAEKVHRFTRPQMHGLTEDQMLRAVRQWAESGVGTGGGTPALNTGGPGIFLIRHYSKMPAIKTFIRNMDSLNSAALKWTRKHYLEALKSYAAKCQPPPSAVGEQDGFKATLILTTNPSRTVQLWNRPPGASFPFTLSETQVQQGGRIDAFIIFSGLKKGPDGRGKLVTTFSLLGPQGEDVRSPITITMWEAPSPPETHPQITPKSMTLTLDHAQSLGNYMLIASVDQGNQECLKLQHPVEVISPSQVP